MRTSIWLVRHGQTRWNQQRRYQGAHDTPLTAYGQRQVAALTYRLRRIPFGVALVSPAGRTRTMADGLLAARSGVQRHAAPAWAEVNQGRWEGLTYHEVLARFPNEAQQRFALGTAGRAQGGESLDEVAARVLAGWQALAREHPGGRVLVVTHATPIQVVLCVLSGTPLARHWQWRVDLGSVTSVDIYGGTAIIRMVNEVPPLLPPTEPTALTSPDQP